MALIEEFKEKTLATDGSFDMIDPGKNYDTYYHFMQHRIGAARYIYGCNSVDEDYYLSIEAKYKLIAIVSDRDSIIYLVDTFFFISERFGALPEGVRHFHEFVKELNTQAVDVIFPKFIDDLSVVADDFMDEGRLDMCISKARGTILNGRNSYEFKKPNVLIVNDDVAKILCGFDTLEGIVAGKFSVHQEKWAYHKAEVLKINEFVQNKFEVVTPCELAIVESLQKADDAKSVTVEFTVNGKTAAEKMSPDTIISRMIYGYSFDDYAFVSSKRGKELMEKLKVGFKFNRDLTPNDISKITYGKKVLYAKE